MLGTISASCRCHYNLISHKITLCHSAPTTICHSLSATNGPGRYFITHLSSSYRKCQPLPLLWIIFTQLLLLCICSPPARRLQSLWPTICLLLFPSWVRNDWRACCQMLQMSLPFWFARIFIFLYAPAEWVISEFTTFYLRKVYIWENWHHIVLNKSKFMQRTLSEEGL